MLYEPEKAVDSKNLKIRTDYLYLCILPKSAMRVLSFLRHETTHFSRIQTRLSSLFVVLYADYSFIIVQNQPKAGFIDICY